MWPSPQETADLVTFTEEILNGKPFLCSDIWDKEFEPETKNIHRKQDEGKIWCHI